MGFFIAHSPEVDRLSADGLAFEINRVLFAATSRFSFGLRFTFCASKFALGLWFSGTDALVVRSTAAETTVIVFVVGTAQVLFREFSGLVSKRIYFVFFFVFLGLLSPFLFLFLLPVFFRALKVIRLELGGGLLNFERFV